MTELLFVLGSCGWSRTSPVPRKDSVFRLPNRVEAAGGSTPIWSMIETRAELEVRYSLCGSRSCLVELLTTCPEALKPR